MSVTDGQVANQTTFNNAFLSRTSDSDTQGRVGLNNSLPESGSQVLNAQRAINKSFDTVGIASESDAAAKVYASNNILINGENHKQGLENIDIKFADTQGNGGHKHTGVSGDGAKIDAATLDNINNYFANYQSIILPINMNADNYDVSSLMTGKVPNGGVAALGVITTAPNNKVVLVDGNGTFVETGLGERVHGRITESGMVWTLAFFYYSSGVETAFVLNNTLTISAYFLEVFDQFTRPTIPSSPAEFGTLDITADVVDASLTARGLVSIGAQSFNGTKTFNNNIIAVGTITASNISGSHSGTNTGDVTLSTIDTTPNANGLSIAGQVLKLAVADASFGGALSTTAQTIAGSKTFNDYVNIITGETLDNATDSTSTGTLANILTPSKPVLRLTNASLTSVAQFSNPVSKKIFILINATGSSVTLKNEEAGATASNRIITGTNADMDMANNSSVYIYYDDVTTRWRVIGGSGGGGTGGGIIFNTTQDSVNTNFVLNPTKARQCIRVTNLVSLNAEIFGTNPANFVDGMEVILEGSTTSFDEPIVYNDIQFGCVGNFSELYLNNYETIKFYYRASLERFILC